jgi:hypothetical protein
VSIQSTARKSEQSEVTISGRLANRKPGKRTNQKAPQLTIHIRKYFVPNGEWTLHPTKRGVTLSLYEWKELKKIIPLFEEREPELRTIGNKVTGED